MKQILTIIMLLFFTGLLNAQHSWSVGLSFQPTRYRLYNKTENNAPANLFGVVKPGPFQITSMALGITAGHRFSTNLAFETELTWSKNEQKFEWQDSPPYPTNFYKVDTKLQYFKLPMLFKYNFDIGNTYFMYLKTGFQLSYLHSYSEQFNWINVGASEFNQIIENGEMSNTSNSQTFECDWLYNRLLFGIVGGLGFEYFITESQFSVNLGIRYEFDITNADNLGARRYDIMLETETETLYTAFPIWKLYRSVSVSNTEIAPLQSRKASHNIRFGIEIGAKYHFGKKTYRIKKVKANW